MTRPVRADASNFDDFAPALSSPVPLTQGRSNALLLLAALIRASAFAAQAVAIRSRRSFALANRVQGAMLVACGQFVACSLLALPIGFATEPITAHGLRLALPVIVYAGVLSVGLGFTHQVVAQRPARAADAATVLSSETVFAAASGALFTDGGIGFAELAGCALILVGVLTVQLQPIVGRWSASTPFVTP